MEVASETVAVEKVEVVLADGVVEGRARRPPVLKIDDHAPKTGKIFFGLALGAAHRARRASAVVSDTIVVETTTVLYPIP